MKKYNIAIAGATGLVGQKIMEILFERNVPINELKLLASKRSAGKEINFGEQTLIVEELTKDSFNNVDVAFFSAGGEVSKQFVPEAVKAGAIVIDNTSMYRMDEDVPLVVPEVNAHRLKDHKGVIANPNCSTIQLVVALSPIKMAFGLNRVIVSTYQSISGAGNQAIDIFKEDSIEFMNKGFSVTEEVQKEFLSGKHKTAFNLVPQIDRFLDNGYTAEEMKMINESKKILEDDQLQLAATCVRVPVLRSHSESVYVEIEEDDVTLKDFQHILKQENNIILLDDQEKKLYPTPLLAENKDEVFIGRMRHDLFNSKGFHLWIVSDNIVKGAALNTVQILEALMEERLI